MTLPKILMIDDIYGSSWAGANRYRPSFCRGAGLQDESGDIPAAQVSDPVALVEVCSGQVMVDGYVQNDLDRTLQVIRSGWQSETPWALIVLDMHFKTGEVSPDGEVAGRQEDDQPGSYFGLQLLAAIDDCKDLADLPIIILSDKDRGPIEERFSARAISFCDKNDLDRTTLRHLLWNYGLISDLQTRLLMEQQGDAEDREGLMVGKSILMMKALREARTRAPSRDENIFILGETGCGKELLAKYTHRVSRRKGPYAVLNVLTVPETLIEDRLFGHVAGAYNGAKRDEAGLIEKANGGTIFIDEFGAIPTPVQQKLLRFLEQNTREVQRIGSAETKRVDVLVVMATNRHDLLVDPDFQADILRRANVQQALYLPPLRERREDIDGLAEYLVHSLEMREAQGRHVEHRSLPLETRQLLRRYDWPQNVAELRTVIHRAIQTYPELRILHPNHLQLGPLAPLVTPVRQEPVPLPEGEVAAVTTGAGPRTELRHADDIDNLVKFIEQVRFDALRKPDLWGRLFPLQGAFARLHANYLKAVFVATSARDTYKPEPAIKHASGDEKRAQGAIPGRITKKILDPQLSSIEKENLKDVYREIQSDDVLSGVLDMIRGKHRKDDDTDEGFTASLGE